MSAPHFFVPSLDGDRIELGADDARHAVRVLRIRPGEHITVSDGEGAIVDAAVVEASRSVVAEVVARRHVPRTPPSLRVFQGIAKAGKLELVVQKLTEIGVDEIVPLTTGRSVARWEGPGPKIERLRAIAREAAKQSRRAWLPVVGKPISLEEVPSEPLTLVLHEEASSRLSESLPEQAPDHIGLVVGPEGGFSADEVASLEARGVVSAGLGPQILRTETAALVAATVVFARYGRIG